MVHQENGKALEILQATNNFPEFTGHALLHVKNRVC
jgi:NADPH-dependent glutamate synthase beta subunit-like oxidoreductase